MLARVEVLESRLLLAASLRLSNGALSVLGNAAADDVLISGTGLQGEVDVAVDQDGDGTRELTQHFSGVQSIVVATGQGTAEVTLRNVDILGGVQITTGGAADEVVLEECRLGDPLRVALGEGHDQFRLSKFSTVRGKVDVSGGGGHDELRITGGVNINGTLKLHGNAGNDQLELRRSVVVLGAATFALGSENNEARLEDNVQLVSSWSVTGGAQADQVRLRDNVRIGGDAVLNLGAGENEVRVEQNVEVTGWLNIATGGQADDVVIQHDLSTGRIGLGRLTISTGAGSDDLDLVGAVVVDGATLINTGADNDRLDLGDASQPLTTLLGGGLWCDFGSGNDEFTVGRTQITSTAWVDGGRGLDAGDDLGFNSFTQRLQALNFDGGNLRR